MRRLIFLSIIFFLVLCQVTFLNYLKIFSVKPDLLIIVVVLTSVFLKPWEAVFFSMAAGFSKDIFTIYGIGINTLLFPVWSLIIIRVSRKIAIDDNYALMVIMFIVVFINSIICRLVFLPFDRAIPFYLFLRIMFIESVYTSILLPVIYKCLNYFKCLAPCRENKSEDYFD